MNHERALDTRSPNYSDDEQVTRELATFRQGEVVDLPWLLHVVLLRGRLRTPLQCIKFMAKIRRSRIVQNVVLTQTCDIIRPVNKRPYLQLAPLVRINDIQTAKRYSEGETPQFVAVPEAGADAFADLDLIMTADKRLIVNCAHRPGVTAEPEEVRRFGQAVARKFGRYPFPDYFIESVEPLRKRILRRWDKGNSPEGRILADLVQIRVRPVPIQPSPVADFALIFIMKQGVLPILPDPPVPTPQIASWLASTQQVADIADKLSDAELSSDDRTHLFNKLAEAWADLCLSNETVRTISGEIISEDEYVLSDYWQSERLDLDQLSGPVTSG